MISFEKARKKYKLRETNEITKLANIYTHKQTNKKKEENKKRFGNIRSNNLSILSIKTKRKKKKEYCFSAWALE
jgi:hypothetical protein